MPQVSRTLPVNSSILNYSRVNAGFIMCNLSPLRFKDVWRTSVVR